MPKVNLQPSDVLIALFLVIVAVCAFVPSGLFPFQFYMGTALTIGIDPWATDYEPLQTVTVQGVLAAGGRNRIAYATVTVSPSWGSVQQAQTDRTGRYSVTVTLPCHRGSYTVQASYVGTREYGASRSTVVELRVRADAPNCPTPTTTQSTTRICVQQGTCHDSGGASVTYCVCMGDAANPKDESRWLCTGLIPSQCATTTHGATTTTTQPATTTTVTTITTWVSTAFAATTQSSLAWLTEAWQNLIQWFWCDLLRQC